MTTNISAKGSCLCKAVSYEATGDALTAVICHCLNCQKATGSTMASVVYFREEQVTFSDPQNVMKWYDDNATSSGSIVKRSFCSVCGSPLGLVPEAAKKAGTPITVMTGGSLDHVDGREMWQPKMEIYCMSKKGWLPDLLKDGKKFERSQFEASTST